MPFISYAQTFEDVMLWRALKHVKHGFYIDVGANDPTFDSVTKAFYERGWRGINIEPLPSHHRDLQAQRPRDINLCCAAGETPGEIDLFECAIRGWATAEQSVADRHIHEGIEGVYHRVPLRTLADICREYVSSEVHFLKIDVEGLEKQVIVGADFQRCRPWIVVVEATKPNSTEEIYDQWEGLLLAANYRFAYADGLNRFYVAGERADLLPAFKYPPNIFDAFTLNPQHQAEARAAEAKVAAQQAEAKAQQAEAKAQQAEAKAQQAEAKAQQAAARARRAEADLTAVLRIRSRPITAFPRWCAHQARLLHQHGLASRLKALVKKTVRPLAKRSDAFLRTRPKLRLRCIDLTQRLGLYDPLRSFYFRCMGRQGGGTSRIDAGHGSAPRLTVDSLTPRARQIYARLNVAIKHRQKENR